MVGKNGKIVAVMKEYGLEKVQVEEIDSVVWLSPDLAKQDSSHAQVWLDSAVARRLGSLIESNGMKYPKFLIFSGRKPQRKLEAQEWQDMNEIVAEGKSLNTE